MRRRTLLAAGGAALLPVSAAAFPTPAHAADLPAADFTALRARAAELLTGGAFDPADPAYTAPLAVLETGAATVSASLVRDPARELLFADLPNLTTTIANVSLSYRRLRTLAVAWATPGTRFTGDTATLDDVLGGLDLLYTKGYNETKPETGNWWFWEIGNPRALMDICVLVHDHLGAERLAAATRVVDRFVPDADRRTNAPTLSETGANRADKAVIVALRGIVGAGAEKLALARDGVSDVRDGGRNTLLDYETAGDGFYSDGSFIQHTSIAYTGTYGNVLLSSLSFILRLLTASSWEVTDPKRTVIFDAIERSFAPLMHDGLMLDCVAGRAVSRQTAGNHAWGNDTITGSLLLAESAPEPYASRFRALAKSWIEQRTAVPYLGAASLAVLPRALAVVGDDTIRPAERLLGHTVFADMDRVLHRRPRWTFALSLSSKRIATYESGNGEHPRGWFTGDGMTYVYDRDQTHYSDAYWPTVDAQRLPGTTVDTLPRAHFSGSVSRPATSWAGGVELGGAGAAGMDLAAWGCTLRAKKSWFGLGDAVVALGAGITSTDGRAIETIVDNRNLHAAGTNRLTIDGRRQPGDQGWTETFDEVSHAHLAGVGGYVFPGGASLHALREERTGSWRDINDGADTGGSPDPVTRRYVTLWFDHGADPAGADYAYILLPGADSDETRRHALTRPIRVLANTAAVQAVSTRDGLLAANFWQGATVGDLASDGPASLMIRRSRGRIEIAVSDPSRTATTVTIDLPHAVASVLSADETVTVTPGTRGRIAVAVGGSRGHAHRAVLRAG
ncbi:polysaccharide lyase 8 family protein [Phytomonospora endophytica]|uniref:Hyaluronate lyase n=1 Tax=Phytomonospora endophytica TaxID=714109 RepID=A0A841FIY2_9ACTN|nr:polysaccharide lyase 8 family protein [Phytomonospora endophytica]MBB6035765.1 hyaluronate lyase [Phytomonospora endophytica]GIG69556.1 lyase [Phytomonospora endophytica]